VTARQLMLLSPRKVVGPTQLMGVGCVAAPMKRKVVTKVLNVGGTNGRERSVSRGILAAQAAFDDSAL